MGEITRSGWAKDRALGQIYLVLLVPALLVALFAPPKVLSAFPAVDQYTMVLRNIFPMIDRLALVSPYPEVTRLILSIEWTLVPVQTVLMLMSKDLSIDLDLLRQRRAFIAVMLPVFVGIFLWTTTFLFDVTPDDLQDSSWLRLASTTRLGLAIVSSLVMTLTAFLMAYLLRWIGVIPRVYFD